MIRRHSSRLGPLAPVLAHRLAGAVRYDRIAGYFRSSLLEVVGEAIEGVGAVRIVCNGELDPHDVAVARAARDGGTAVARALISNWRSTEDGLDALLARERYRRLHALLVSGRLKVRVVAAGGAGVFVHGKAGVVTRADGSATAFVGSVNDSLSGWKHAYELLWEDDDPAAVAWAQAEFDHFWDQGVDLPDAVVRHIGAVAGRSEYASVAAARAEPDALAPAALAERPLYRAGQILRPWQKRFVQTCVDEHRIHGRARFLIADDVGLGKTLSMGAAALVLSLLDARERPVLILTPATLTWQWQAELGDMLGVPAAVWSSSAKQWLDQERVPLTPRGDAAQVLNCPRRFGIVSTGLIVNGDDEGERGLLKSRSFSVVILDEAHKARADRNNPIGDREGENNLLAFMRELARGSASLLLGTATPIQLRPVELWDLTELLSQGAPEVLGRAGEWRRDGAMDYLSGRRPWPTEAASRWALLRDPMPPRADHRVFRDVRNAAGLNDSDTQGPRFDALPRDLRTEVDAEFDDLAGQQNPIVRRVVRRTRPMLEAQGLLTPIAVANHPRPGDGLPAAWFRGEGLEMGIAFGSAYEAAERFCRHYAQRRPAAGFLKTVLLRRIGSSPAAGLATTLHLLTKADADLEEAERGDAEPVAVGAQPPLDAEEIALLRAVRDDLQSVARQPDPKVDVILAYLRDRSWLETHGAIVFSQYRTTAEWVAAALSEAFPQEPIALYAGGAASFVQRGADRRHIPREQIKDGVQRGELRLVLATDAACEGLNLQKLGAQFNVDLPWNPSRLEQRKGRIQRIGQARPEIHVVSLRYAGTVEDQVYSALSARLGDIFAVLGQLPDGFEDAWIGAVLEDREAVRSFPQRANLVRPAMERRYWRDAADDDGLDWEATSKVLSSVDLKVFLQTGW